MAASTQTHLQFMDLPPELADNILASVSDTPDARQTLGACALVCRTWRQLAYPYLFKTLQLNFSLADETLIKESQINVKTVEQITSFFNASPLVAPCVRTLQLRQVLKHQAVPAEAFYRVLEPLHRLQRLSLYNFLLAPSPSTIFLPQLSCSLDFLEIYTGELRGCGDYLVTSKEIHDITHFFPRIDHLCLSTLPTGYREEKPEDSTNGALALPAVRQLSIINPSSFDLLFRALHHMPMGNLRVINLENLSSRDLEHVGRFLSSVGSTLESLRLGEVWSTNVYSAGMLIHQLCTPFTFAHNNLFCMCTDELLCAMHNLNLSACQVLDSFTFTIPLTLASNVPNAASTPVTASHWRLSHHTFSAVREIISTVIPSWTRSVGLDFRKNSMYQRFSAQIGLVMGEMNWKGLDETLVARTASRSDAQVRVQVKCDGWTTATIVPGAHQDAEKEREREALKEYLPRVAAMDMLRF